jgi:uncharacterized protein (TIGR00730 family)
MDIATFDPKKFFEKNLPYIEEQNLTIKEASSELQNGLRVLARINKPIVGVFGSHRARRGTADFDHCYSLCSQLAQNGYAIITGGGSGIMYAANKAAYDAGTCSVGMSSNLLTKEQILEPVYTDQAHFRFFFVRRFVLSIKTSVKLFYPGGAGTLNELYEYAMLMHNNIVDRVPIICIGTDFWSGLFDWMKKSRTMRDYLASSDNNESLFTVLDDPNEILNTIAKHVPTSSIA